MADIFDYLMWRGDLTLENSPLNAVDGMILARLSYLPFENIVDSGNEPCVTVGAACEAILQKPDIENKVLLKDDTRLMAALRDSARYRDMPLSGYVNELDAATQTQFSCITVGLGGNDICVSFRGTDNTIIGWKEDFNMCFVCPVPAQVLASRYVERLANEKPEKNIVITGHSKGGNLAVYAAAFCDDGVQKRITSVFNYDGPGFDDRVLRTESYKRICKRIMTFVPQSSVIGMLLGHEEAYTIVHSEQTGMMQHDVYSWDVRRDGFDCLERVDNSSRFVDFTLKAWITDLDYKQRESFFDTVYTVMKETNASTLREMGENWFASAVSVLKSIKNLDEATRKAALRTLGLLVKCAGMGISHMWQTREKTQAPAKTEAKS